MQRRVRRALAGSEQVTKRWSPKTEGEEWPVPGSSIFQLKSEAENWTGILGAGEARPEPFGPRKRGQVWAEQGRDRVKRTRVKVKCFIGFLLYPRRWGLFVDCSLWRLLREWDQVPIPRRMIAVMQRDYHPFSALGFVAFAEIVVAAADQFPVVEASKDSSGPK